MQERQTSVRRVAVGILEEEITGVDQSKEHPLSSDSEMNDNLDLYRRLLWDFHKNKCSLSEERVKILINVIFLELGISLP